MKKILLLLFLFVGGVCQVKAEEIIPGDSTVYQFGNDSVLQTLTIYWKSDSTFGYHLLSQDLHDRGSVSARGEAFRKSSPDEPVIKPYLDKEFPAVHFVSPRHDCKLNIYVQFMYRERVWVERECKVPPIPRKVSLDSAGMLEKVK